MSPWTPEQLAEDQARFRKIKRGHRLTAWDRAELFEKKHRYGEFREFLKVLEARYRTTPAQHGSGRRRKGPFTPDEDGPNGPGMHKLSEEQR